MKKAIAFLLLFALWSIASLCAAARTQISADELYIRNVGEIQLGWEISPADISEVLGEVLELNPGGNDSAMYVICEGGTVWLARYGDGAMDTEASVQCAIFTKEDVSTRRGVQIGDDAALVVQTYGQPASTRANKKKSYQGVVDVWQTYHAGPLERIAFGIRNGRVTAIAVSKMAGGV